jgi:hypothetical protein
MQERILPAMLEGSADCRQPGEMRQPHLEGQLTFSMHLFHHARSSVMTSRPTAPVSAAILRCCKASGQERRQRAAQFQKRVLSLKAQTPNSILVILVLAGRQAMEITDAPQ